MLAVGRSRLAASSGLSLPKLSAIVARAIARSGPLSSGAANAIASQATFAPFVKANLPLLATIVLREYATATKKTATKKTATKKKTTSAKKSTKKPAARRRTVAKKSGTRRTATKKKTAAKKKAAPKKKKVVRRKKAVVKKPGIRVQYDKAMDAPPKKVSPYNLFFVESSKEMAGTKASERAKLTAVQWHALSENDKQVWKDRAAEESIKRKAAYAQWLAKQNPVDIAAANNARSRIRAHRLLKGIKGSASVARIKDDRLVKRALSPWIFFVKEKIQTPEIVALGRNDKLMRMSELWKATTDANKKKYADLAAKDAIRYKNEKAEFEKKYKN